MIKRGKTDLASVCPCDGQTGSRRLEDLLNPPISPALLASRGAPIKQDPVRHL